MDFDDIKEGVIWNANDYEKRYGVKIDREFAHMKLVEEVGEFMQAVLVHERKSRPEKHLDPEASKHEVAMELADVLGMVIVCADRHDIDLEKALGKKWLKRFRASLEESEPPHQ